MRLLAGLAVVAGLVLASSLPIRPAMAAQGAPRPLPSGTTVTATLTGDETHRYDLTTVAASAGVLTVEQRGVDGVVTLPVADALEPHDGPFDRQGFEELWIPAGTPWVEVRGRVAWGPEGTYRVTWRPGEDLDPLRRQALQAETRAAREYARGTPEGWRASLEAATTALERRRRLEDDPRRARAAYWVAVLLRLTDQPREALERATEAVDSWQGEGHGLGHELQLAYTFNERGLSHFALGRYDLAEEEFQRARQSFEATGDVSGLAVARGNLCLLDLARGALRDGAKCYAEVLPLYERAAEVEYQAVAASNSGRAWDLLGEPDRALELYRRALALQRRAGHERGEAQVLNNLAVLHRRVGEIQEALGYYSEALEVFRRLGDRRWQGLTLHNLAFAYEVLGASERALPLWGRALELRRELGDRRGEAATLNSLATLHRREGRVEQALLLRQRALELRRALEDRAGEAVALALLGEDWLAAGRPHQAEATLERARELTEETGDLQTGGDVAQALGRVALARGDTARAIEHLARALEIHRVSRNPVPELATLEALARAHRAAGQTREAEAYLERAIELLENLRSQLVSPDLRARFLATARAVYEGALDLLADRHRAEPDAGHDRRAFQVSEAARGRLLLETLRIARVEPAPEPLRSRLRQARRRLAARAARLAAADAEERQEWEERILETRTELEALEAQGRRQSPAFAALTEPPEVTVAEIQALLPPRTLLLEYVLGEGRSLLWILGGETVELHELPPRGVLEEEVRRFHARLSNADAAPGLARGLGERLLGPLGHRSEIDQLLIVPDGALHYLPFTALADPATGDPVVERWQVATLPSASVLGRLRSMTARPPPPRPAAVFADPVFRPTDPRWGGSAERLANRSRAVEPEAIPVRLPATAREARAVAALPSEPGARLFLGFDAHRRALLDLPAGEFRVLHIATHGVIDARRPELSGLWLSRFDASGRPQEGFVGLEDLHDLRLDSELAVLSGCQTALGGEIRGEGLVGLTHGFMAAGVPRVIASLWPVEDRATAELMELFYRGLWRDGLSPAAALRRAQRELRRRPGRRDPYFWAGFVHQGPP